jgi:Leucine-rich repeat (LRR) protein
MSIRFTNILKNLIMEQSRFQVLYDKFVKPPKGGKGIIPFETLFALIAADPTTKIPDGMDIDNVKPQDMDRVKIGKYAQWLIKNFITPKLPADHPLMISDPQSGQYKQALAQFQALFMEDLYKVTTNLQKYERFKNRLSQEYRDINKLSIETLQDQVKDFSLEKTKATADEKKEASVTYAHPGADIVYRGQDWTVAKISNTGPLGKEAACFYGGSHNEGRRGETTWCTSSPGYTWFERYIAKGPLYVVIPNTPSTFKTYGKETGEVSGLPANRYQFHFPDNQYMDADDRQINLIDFLNTNEEGLKQFFKPEFMSSLTGEKGTKVQVEYPNDSASKFIALYGFDEFFDSLPQNIQRFTFKNSGKDKISLNVPNDISKFKELTAINFVGCVASIPESICDLPKLQYLSLVDNPNLQQIPECLANMPNLMVVNIPGASGKNIIPQALYDRDNIDDDFHIFE